MTNSKLFLLLITTALFGLSSCQQSTTKVPSPTSNIEVLERYPLAEGVSLGAAGAYEVIKLRIESFIDVKHPEYGRLNDSKLWTKQGEQFAPYATTMLIFRPVDAAKANGTVLFEWPNRGRTFALGLFNEARPPRAQKADEPSAVLAEIPKTPREFGNKFLFNQGYTLVWAGWEANTYRRPGIFAELPIHDTGQTIEVTEEFAVGFRAKETATALPLMFESVATKSNKSSLKKRLTERSIVIDTSSFSITHKNELVLTKKDGGVENFERGAIYELKYAAQKYPLSGFGLALMNEIALGIKQQGTLSKLATWLPQKEVANVLSMGASQPGRALRTFLRKLPDAKGFDGHYIIAAGAGQALIDRPFPQTSKTATAFHDSFLPEFLEEESLLLPSEGAKVMEIHTSSEYWQKIAFLTHAKKDGTARQLAENHRIYLLAGTQHSGGNGVRSSAGPCLFQRNLSKPTPILRGLFTALNEWTLNASLPPATSVPLLENNSLLIADSLDFTKLLGIKNPMPHNPPIFNQAGQSKQLSKIFIPNIDAIGNEQGGIQSTAIAIPLSTRTGWNIDKHPARTDCLCHQYGAYFPLARTKANQNADDKRPTIADLYPDEEEYVKQVTQEINQLVASGFLLSTEKAQLKDAALKQYHRTMAQPK